MKTTNETGKRTVRKLFTVFGWRIYASRAPLKKRIRSHMRKELREAALAACGGECHRCGKRVEPLCRMSMHSRLDTSHPIEERYAPENVVILCPECNRRFQLERSRERLLADEALRSRPDLTDMEFEEL